MANFTPYLPPENNQPQPPIAPPTPQQLAEWKAAQDASVRAVLPPSVSNRKIDLSAQPDDFSLQPAQSSVLGDWWRGSGVVGNYNKYANHADSTVGDPGSPKAPLPAAETNGALSYLGDPALPSKAPGQSAAETNGALSYLGNKSVEAGLANRTKGADLVANQGFTQVDNLQAAPGNYKGNPFFRKTTDLGNGMEEYKVEIPGKGWMTGVRKFDPNRQQGTFSVTPGLSDAERQQVAQIDANQARQAAYGVSRKTGELYDAAQQHQQQQAALWALKQMQMQQEQNYRNQQLSLEQRKAAAAEANNAGKLMVDQGNMLTQGRRAEQQSAHDRASRQDNFMKDHFRKWATESPAGIQSKNQWDDFATSNLGVLSAGARTNEPPKFATPYASKTAGMIDMVYPDGKVRTVPYIDYVDALSQ